MSRRVNARDLTHEVVHALTTYRRSGHGGEGDVDDACRYWLLDGNGIEMFVYDFEENEKGPVSPFPVDFSDRLRDGDQFGRVCGGALARAESERYNGIE